MTKTKKPAKSDLKTKLAGAVKAAKKAVLVKKKAVVTAAAPAAKKATSNKKKTAPVKKSVQKTENKKLTKKAAALKKVEKPVPEKARRVEKTPVPPDLQVPHPKKTVEVHKPKRVLVVDAKEKTESPEAASKKVKPAPTDDELAAEMAQEAEVEEIDEDDEEVDAVEAEAESDEDVILTDAEGRRYCRVKDCDQIATVDTYCRYHYLLFWKKIQVRKKILSEGKLERYIEELTARYPDKYLEMLKKDLKNEKDFMAAIHELEIDESGVDTEYEDEAQSYIDEVRGMSGEGPAREEDEY